MATHQRATLPLPAFGENSPESFDVLGVRIHAIQIPEALQIVNRWIAQGDRRRYVAVTGMHGVTEAQHDPRFKNILNAADLTVPDGMPLVWLGRLRGFQIERRVYGPELMLSLCASGTQGGLRHFFYGAMPSHFRVACRRTRATFSRIANCRKHRAAVSRANCRRRPRIRRANQRRPPRHSLDRAQHAQARALDVRASRSSQRPGDDRRRRRV